MPILNYTTKIDAEKTAGEVTRILAKAKVASTATFYDVHGAPEGISFTLNTPHGPRTFQLPVNVDGVHARLKSDRQVQASFQTREQATRVAWRIAKDWVEAQLAIVSAGMVTIDEVMLPYLLTPNGNTVYGNYKEREQSALEA